MLCAMRVKTVGSAVRPARPNIVTRPHIVEEPFRVRRATLPHEQCQRLAGTPSCYRVDSQARAALLRRRNRRWGCMLLAPPDCGPGLRRPENGARHKVTHSPLIEAKPTAATMAPLSTARL